jgi:hypothetical protein
VNSHPATIVTAPEIPHELRRARATASVGWMVFFGFAARIAYILIAHSYKFRTNDANFSFGWEIGRLAYSLATDRGFSSPFGGETGPSAWNAPIYPWLVSLAFRMFGLYSHAASFAMLAFNSFCAALTCWPIVRIARRVFNERVAFWSGWIWALLPFIIYWSVRWVWETSLTALLLALVFMLTLDMEGDARLTSWFGYGLLWGVIGLTNPSALAFLPFSGMWLAYSLYRRGRRFLLPAITGAVVFWLTLLPWLVRNYGVFHEPAFVRDNIGEELRCGNNPLAEGMWVGMYHPTQNKVEFERYKRLGEPAYAAEQGRLANEWMAANPGKAAQISFRKFIYFWDEIPSVTDTAEWMQQHPQKWVSRTFWPVVFRPDGSPRQWLVNAIDQIKPSLFLASSLLSIGGLVLALKRRVHGVFLFATLVLFYPLVYYLTFPHPRYRHPIEPELLILGVYLVTESRPQLVAPSRQDLLEMDEFENLPVYHTLSILIPVYNERKTVMKLLRQVAQQPLSLNKELIIIDDCSKDGTREFLQSLDLERELGEGGRNTVRLVLHEKNMGKGAGIRSAVQYCTGDLVMIQDADLEYDPGDYPKLVAPILEGHAEVVYGNRFHSGQQRVRRFYHSALNRAFSILCNVISDLDIHDVMTCYKVFKREIFQSLNLHSDGFGMETEITAKLARMKVRIYEVPILYRGRSYEEGKKIKPVDAFIALWEMLRYRFRDLNS